MAKKISKREAIYLLLLGILLNGYIQGQMGKKLDSAVIKEADRAVKLILESKKIYG